MIKRNLNLQWFCFSQITKVDKKLLKLMKMAGCYNIGFGIESAVPRIQKIIGKVIPLEKCHQVIKDANSLGIKTQAFFVLGYEESLEEIQATIEFALQLNPTLCFFNFLVPYPGTRDFSKFFGEMPLSSVDWEHFVAIGEHTVLTKTNIDWRKVIYDANLRFYSRGSQIIRMLSHINTGYEFKNYLKGGLGLFFQMIKWKS
jgi:radical SAM superfamily enzyme YgiQ (UPF0313 family)